MKPFSRYISEAYINASEVKVIRNDLKKEFPAFTFEVTKGSSTRIHSNSSSINIYILSGPFKFSPVDGNLNHYHHDKYQHGDVLQKMVEVINKKNVGSHLQIDIFDVGFYVYIHQGRDSWNGSKKTVKPYVVTGSKASATPKAAQTLPQSQLISKAPRNKGKMPIIAGLTFVEFVLDGKVVEEKHYKTSDKIHGKFVRAWLETGMLPNGSYEGFGAGKQRSISLNGVKVG